MGYYNKTISVYGTELQFVQALIAAITESDSRITCTTTDIETQYAASSGTPNFTFSIDGYYTMIFTRNASIGSSANGFNVYAPKFGDNYSTSIQYDYNNTSKTSVSLRSIKLSIITNTEDIYFRIAPCNGNIEQNGVRFLSAKNNNNNIIIGREIDARDIMNTVFITTDETPRAYSAINRLLYTYAPMGSSGGVEVIQNKVFKQYNSINREFAFSKLWDVSTVAADSKIKIDDVLYYAISSHTLMCID